MPKNLYLWQPQYAIEFRTEDNYWLPYSAACLWSYVSQFDDIKKNWQLAELIFKRQSPEEVLSRLQAPAVCGFSCYVWNENYCLALAEMVKQRWPSCIIIFGGPQASASMLQHKFIDSIIMAEGEEIFLEILRSINEGRRVEKFYKKRRLEQLDIPSPYLTGLFDSIIEQNARAIWSAVLETNRGCPFSCTFCDWGGVTYSKVKKFPLDKIQQEIEWCAKNSVGYIFIADANFGVFRQRDLEIAQMIRDITQGSKLEKINIQFAKNSTEVVFEIAKTLGSLNKGLTFSVQSMNEPTLKAIKRDNLEINDMRRMMQLSIEYDVPTYTEVILGLPLETTDTWRQGLAEIVEMGQHCSIDLWFAQLLENSELNSPDSRRMYKIETIRAQDYMGLYNSRDYRDISEEIELVKSTSTMTTQEIIDNYLYAWMYIHLHISGYSQIYAKYARYRHHISYRQFYDHMWEKLWHNDDIQSHLNEMKQSVAHYINTGRLLAQAVDSSGHALHSRSYGWLFENRRKVFAGIKKIVSELVDVSPNLQKLQENFLIDPDVEYPVKVNLPYDIDTWQDQNINYEIMATMALDGNFDFYRCRRQGGIKNKIIVS